MENQNWKPYFTFNFLLVSHQFNQTPYFRKHQDKKVIRDKVWELYNKGWRYTKIHRYLIDNNYDIGKSRTTVNSMIKKRIKARTIFQSSKEFELVLDSFIESGNVGRLCYKLDRRFIVYDLILFY